MAADLILHKETMSSLEIAELTGKQHAHVMRDIRSLLEHGVSESNFGLGSYSDANGQNRPCYNLTKKGCLILASGYDAKLRERIIDRWEQLETEKKQVLATLPDFSNPAEAARAWADQYEKAQTLALENKQQAEKIQSDKPKVIFADAVSTSQRSCLVAELAKIIQQNGVNIGQNRLFAWLRENGYLCSKGQYYNQPTQKAMKMGLFEIKQTTINKPDGSILVSVTTKVTGKGQIYFVNKFIDNESVGRAAV